MPPQISDDEGSGSEHSERLGVPIRQATVERVEKSATVKPEKNGKGRGKTKAVEEEEEKLEVESHEDEEDEDEDMDEDEYVVEKILNHLVDDEDGTIKYEVKWAGFEKKSDRTWEPEENLVTAPEVLTAYLSKVGGKEAIIAEWEEKKGSASEPKGRKRGRSSVGANGGEAPKKKGRKSHPASSTPPASAKQEFKPPTGSWEEDVIGIDACEGPKGDVLVYLTWKGQHKTQHPLSQVYKRCPQRMLKFYESHLVFKKTEPAEDES